MKQVQCLQVTFIIVIKQETRLAYFPSNINDINNLATLKRSAFCFLSMICITFNTRKVDLAILYGYRCSRGLLIFEGSFFWILQDPFASLIKIPLPILYGRMSGGLC